MKKIKHCYLWCLSLLTLFFVFSCVEDKIENGQTFDEGSLNATGQVFTKAVQAFPAWGKSWGEISKIGTPLLNEVLFLYNFPKGAFCLVPVVSNKEIIALAFFPLDSEGNYDEIKVIGEPIIVKGEAINTNLMARGFLKSDCYKKLTDKGYKCSVKLAPLPPPKVQIKTKSTSATCTQGININATIYFSYNPANPTEYYTRMYACDYAFSTSMQQLESQYIQYFIGYDMFIYFMYQFEYTRGEYIQLLDPYDAFNDWETTLNNNAWSNVAGIISVVFEGPNPIHECDSHEEYYAVNLTAHPTAGGYVTGAGNYPSGSLVNIMALNNSGYKFVNWTGNTTISTFFATLTVDSIMNFTANFRPCYTTDKANPLPHMELAPPYDNRNNIAGATQGETRKYPNGDDKFHHGIDFAGAVGTPVYAQFDGIIPVLPVTGQPNKVAKHYPNDYSGDKDGAGNRIYVDSNIGGNTVRNGYWHLQAGNPVAINPRTGQPFTTGDPIYAGEVIGYMGHTGNADASAPHVHLITTENGAEVNPEKYLNATISTTTTTITTPCD